jgi:hypothetical protein
VRALTDSQQYTLQQLAQFTRIQRQAAAGQLQASEALDELQRLELANVQVVSLEATGTEIVLEKIAKQRRGDLTLSLPMQGQAALPLRGGGSLAPLSLRESEAPPARDEVARLCLRPWRRRMG